MNVEQKLAYNAQGMRVKVYFNLHRKCYSIKAMEGPRYGKVIAHAKAVLMLGCTFKVSEAGRQRGLREGKKNVHAGIVGMLSLVIPLGCTHGEWSDRPELTALRLRYNPNEMSTFELEGKEIWAADQVICGDRFMEALPCR